MSGRTLASLATLALLASATGNAAGQEQPPAPASSLDIDGPTTLYFHLWGIQDFPINTQAPDDGAAQAASYGTLTPTATCLSTGSSTGGLDNPYHTYRGYIMSGLLDYSTLENGQPKPHFVRGFASDVVLPKGGAPTFVWYLATEANNAAGTAPAAVPNVVVHATWKEGDQISIDDKAYDAGEVVLAGRSEPATLIGPEVVGGGGQVRALGLVNGRWLYEFAVPQTPQASNWSASAGANLRVDVTLDNPACGGQPKDGYLMPNVVASMSLPAYRPRLEHLEVANPLAFDFIHPTWVDGDLVVHVGITSPWGAYDVHVDTLAFAVTGPANATGLHLAPPPANRTHEHGDDRTGPAVLTFVWPDAAKRAPAGDYVFRLTASNLQRTATLEGEAAFRVGDPAQELPATPVAASLAAIALGLVAARRRQ